MIETPVNVNMVVNQLKTGSSKSTSRPNKNPEAQIPSTVELQQVSCNRHVSKIQVHLKTEKRNVCLRDT